MRRIFLGCLRLAFACVSGIFCIVEQGVVLVKFHAIDGVAVMMLSISPVAVLVHG